ncbi:MAG: NAD(+) diphosphatase [Betaproteobacteria bacterium]|nr:NAD(+) diphosphatase [Betaproteobacteria bacterium]
MIELPFHSPEGFAPSGAAPQAAGPRTWLVFRGNDLLVELGPPRAAPSDDLRVPVRATWARLPAERPNALGLQPLRSLEVGQLAGTRYSTAEVAAGSPAPAGMAWEGLRALYTVLEDAQLALAGRALQLVDWDRTHQYCGRCGTPTAPKADETVRVCPACGLASYPRIAPAVMALVRRGRELLLARGPHFPPGMYSALAGFIEPGESLEQGLAREVAEEVGVAVDNVAYFASQPWPFPHSLMIAFTCEWTAGEIRPRAGEIEAAAWFDVFQLPKIPSKISIARCLIDAAAAQIRRQFGTGA